MRFTIRQSASNIVPGMQNSLRLAVLLPLLLFAGLTQASADDKPEMKLEAILIWGTDGEKPEGKDLQDISEPLTSKFRKIFKWRNYYEVKRTPFALKKGEPPQTVKLSDKSSVIIGYNDKGAMEVELIGEGKSVTKTRQTMPLNDILVLAGDDKNATAWFVVIKPQPQP